MLILRCFELENFKSYKGKHTFGPFMHFTAIVGPNGSGKSNLMEAMSFVVGEKISRLRVSAQKDLIYGGHLSKKMSSFAAVTAYFNDENDEHCLCRKITEKTDEFYINSDRVNKKKYKSFLESFGIFTRINNFMVFQGDIEKIVSETSRERTCIFEKFSGSDKLIKKYDISQKQLKIEMDIFTQALRKRREALTEKRKLDFEKHQADKYNQLRNKITSLQRDIVLLKLHSLNITVDNLKESHDKLNEDKK